MLSGGPHFNYKFFKMISGRQKRQVERCNGRKMHPAIGGFEDGRGPCSEQYRKPLEAENKQTNKQGDEFFARAS